MEVMCDSPFVISFCHVTSHMKAIMSPLAVTPPPRSLPPCPSPSSWSCWRR
jgi:hypothetical protein